ncbi:DUF1819 family protein [Desulfosporosinus sp. BICA1-9]|uniref:DUF1819 family protein n=1 Tax=Desulfosporosinus sp. BICA1-9 TaxID=1531958 RepID=UPI00054BDBE6|nr:DUF1819 family protein [Desulfosporosinus sp. BICA1-9]KJS50641.1 MAG: membrane protein [Peptococcaceae bacterium BRH_c23]KJS88835.1 MAG: membrane protein [Desulfosporosinus sp. BICA1-9]HBW37734.1 DUF1819 domain-containing protein [Desulfosporosinus sp.]
MKKYSAGFTSTGLFKQEIREVLRLQRRGLSRTEIVQEVLNHNLFQMRSEAGIRDRLKRVLQRIGNFDEILLEAYLEGTRFEENALILYSYLYTYRLPYEFFMEIVLYDYLHNQGILRKVELDFFFERKEAETEEIARWSPKTKQRLKSSMLMFFRECGLLTEKERHVYQITPLHVNRELKDYAIDHYPLLAILTTLR